MEFIPTKLGVALIEGFDRMNFETSLGKPFLRKEMELKMKAICEGRTTKEVVLDESIQQYRHVYMQSQQKLSVLKTVGIPSIFSNAQQGNVNMFTGLPTVRFWSLKSADLSYDLRGLLGQLLQHASRAIGIHHFNPNG